jgi:hypothetical protein
MSMDGFYAPEQALRQFGSISRGLCANPANAVLQGRAPPADHWRAIASYEPGLRRSGFLQRQITLKKGNRADPADTGYLPSGY